MTVNILMPALSPTMESGKLAKWLKNEGDPVKAGDVVAEIETDKATMEVEAVDEGVLAHILVPGGTENVAVNTPIAVIALDGESATEGPPPLRRPLPPPRRAPPPRRRPRKPLRRRPRQSPRSRSLRFRPGPECCR